MIAKKLKFWECFKSMEDGTIECNYCKQIYKFILVEKMRNHIEKCPNSPEQMKRTMIDESDLDLPVASLSQPPSPPSTITPPKRAKLISSDENEKAGEALARAIFISGTPLNIAQHPLWMQFFKTIGPSFVPPTEHEITTSMLNEEYVKVKSQVQSTIQNTKYLNLQCDGWSMAKVNDSIINVMITTPEPNFVKCLQNKTDSEFIAKQIKKLLDKFGLHKFFVVVCDNTKTMSDAFTTIAETDGYKHIIGIGCIAHLVHLLYKDVIACEKLHACILSANDVIRAIKRSTRLTTIFGEKQREKGITQSLKLSILSEWGSHLLCLKSLLDNQSVLRVMAGNHFEDNATVKNLLISPTFWENVNSGFRLLKPIVDARNQLKLDKFAINKIFDSFKKLECALYHEFQETKVLTEYNQVIIQNRLTERKLFALQPIHLAAMKLDPNSQGCTLDQGESIDANEFIHSTAMNMELNESEVLKQFGKYENREELWGREFIWIASKKMSPLFWWKTYAPKSELTAVAIRILSAPTTCVAEDLSSRKLGFIHNKKHNELPAERGSKLRYLASNYNLCKENWSAQPDAN